MNKREQLKLLVAKCTEDQQMFFKRMYSPNNIDLPITTVIDNIPQDRLDRAISQCENTIKKNDARRANK